MVVTILEHCLAALAFVPVDDVIINFDILIDAGYPDRAKKVVNYFEDIFIGRPDRRGIRKQSMFPNRFHVLTTASKVGTPAFNGL